MIEGCRENPKSNLASKWYFAFGKLFMLLCARKSSSGISIHYTASKKDSYLNIYPPIRTTSFIPQKDVQGLTSQRKLIKPFCCTEASYNYCEKISLNRMVP
jgi:hypothetical protein